MPWPAPARAWQPTTQTARGGPRTAGGQAAARTKKRLEAQGAALFTPRYLFVQRHLNKTERKTLWRVSHGLPQLRALRAVMDQVYALFDRRCRTQTALDKLAKLRWRLQRFRQLGETLKKLFPPRWKRPSRFLTTSCCPPPQCGRAGQPALSQEAKECLPGTDAGAEPCTSCAGYVA